MGMWGMKNRGDMQKDIQVHIQEINNNLNAMGRGDITAALLQAKSTALLALTQTLPKEK